ncbi:hypothetical protein DPMN_064234 [Dreissena polymorpha]|uniref:Uncharacterized protein n=1 Tax=Dreissena polymorpha TaxID=45954 RepID=A0A9D4CCU4_DREPO|nr:hypothetical protein DPMN_064234 [Dreissena polymorpha]
MLPLWSKWLSAFHFTMQRKHVSGKEFVRFAKCKSTTCEALANAFLENLKLFE